MEAFSSPNPKEPNMPKTEFTPAAFARSHGHLPKGYGAWGFQESATQVAYDADLFGEQRFFTGTLTTAKAAARAAFPAGCLLAVLP